MSGPSKKRRVVALLIGVLAVPLVLELLLQIAALFIGGGRSVTTLDCLVVTQGDSHTYGLWLPPKYAYPAQLEELLRERGVEPAGVVNRGIPGKTTWQVYDELETDLARWKPRVAVLWAGVNDRTGQHPGDDGPSSWDRLMTLKLARNLADRLAPKHEETTDELPSEPTGEEETTFDVTGKALVSLDDQGTRRLDFSDRNGEMRHLVLTAGNPSVEEYTDWIEMDLERSVERSRASGAVPILLLYPVDDGPRLEINAAIERSAEKTGARLVDLRADFERAAEIVDWKVLLYGRGHPKPLGYSIIARGVLNAMIAEGVVDGDPLDVLGAVHEWTPSELSVAPWIDGDAVRGVEVQYAPGHRVQAIFSRAKQSPGVPVTYGGAVVPLQDGMERKEESPRVVDLARDEVFDGALRRLKRYFVPLDADGRARIELHPEIASEPSLWVVVCTVTPHEGVSRVSSPVRLK